MGSIRVLLAISVVFIHSYGFVFVGGKLAVQLFYVISGFLISFILVEAKTYVSTKDFYLNRFLRLYPAYWLIAALALTALLAAGVLSGRSLGAVGTFMQIDLVGKLSLVASNLLIFGQDWIYFTAFNEGSTHLTTNFQETELGVWTGLLVPQAWTLGVELTFYLVAPFILRKKWLVLVLLGGSLILRVTLIYAGLGLQDPWTYRFFPTELALFLLGAVSHQFLKPLYERLGLLNVRTASATTLAVFASCAFFFVLPNHAYWSLLLVAVFVISLPWLFHFQRTNQWDRRIGELSYPIYLSHMLVILVAGSALDSLGMTDPTLGRTLIFIALTVLISLGINKTVGSWVKGRRDSIKARQSNS